MAGPTINGRTYDGVQLVTHEDGNAGFCALITYALNGVRRALELNRVPVVVFDAEHNPRFYDPAHGPNVWEYFFDPVAGMSYAEFRARQAEEGWSVHRFTFDEILKHHLRDPDRIATFWSYDEPKDPAAWMTAKRALGRRMVSKYVRVKAAVRERADAFFRDYLQGSYLLGVHIRGTDFAYAEPIAPELYFDAIRSHARARALDSYKIFLATDQEQFVERFRAEFGDRLVASDCLRSTSAVAPFNLPVARSPYRLGEEVLIDVLLLSRSDHVLKGPSAVGEYALWFAPRLDCTDFALSSRFRPRAIDLLVPAYTSLSVAGQGTLRRWLNHVWTGMEWPRSLILMASQIRRWAGRVLGRR